MGLLVRKRISNDGLLRLFTNEQVYIFHMRVESKMSLPFLIPDFFWTGRGAMCAERASHRVEFV